MCICPAGEFLYQNGKRCHIAGREAVRFKGAKRVCGACELRDRCLRNPEKGDARQVAFFTGEHIKPINTHTERMKRKIDTEEGRYQYAKRLGILEPVFANICATHRLRRFSHFRVRFPEEGNRCRIGFFYSLIAKVDGRLEAGEARRKASSRIARSTDSKN